MKQNLISFTFLVVGLGLLSACQPGPIDPPLDSGFKRVEVDPRGTEWAEDHPLQQMGIPSLWDRTTGKDRDQSRARIAIIGTGVDYTNTDILNSLWVNVGELGDQRVNNGFDDDMNGYADDVIGFDFFSIDGRPYDWHGHDTFTTALIGASAKKNQALVGVAPNAEIMVLRYMGGDGDVYPIDAFQAIMYAVDNGARVIYFNFPQGGFPIEESWWGEAIDYSELVIFALEHAQQNNVLVVIPAGNDGNENISAFIRNPRLQSLDNVIIVAGVDAQGKITSQSNSGVKLATIAARAAGVHSFFPGSELGTGLETSSVAAAYATGAAALISTLPGMGRAKDIRQKLLQAVKIPPSQERLKVLSGGVLNLSAIQ